MMKVVTVACLLMMPYTVFAHNHKQTIPTNYNSIVKLAAATIYLEAGNESNQGKLGVASVIWNRAGGGANIANVILASKQFSCWNHRSFAKFKPPNNKQYAYCLLVAEDLASGIFVPPAIYQGAIAFHTQSVKPYWRKDFKMSIQVGNHLFYTEKET
jgi:spore germination cell wall hydrolase CwlJ-like protein